MYIDKSIKKYLDDLAAMKPAPGGGSAVALEAATGCALMSMAANFTISNKRYSAVRDKAASGLNESEAFRGRLLNLIDGDVRAYGKLSEGLKRYGKDSPQLDKLYKAACDVPFEIARIAAEALDLCGELVSFGNRALITDTAIAALMLESAFFGAKFNVYINLRYIKDDDYIRNIHDTISQMEERIPKLKEEILHKSEEIIIK